jgi:hypothetical protein
MCSFSVLTPNVHQYNITEKIKEANSVLFSNENVQRKHSPKVKFRDHKLVDFEDDGESMEIQVQSSIVEDEVSDDGYSEEIVNESIEIEDVSEQVQQDETEIEEEKEPIVEENYDKEAFHEEVEEIPVENCEKPGTAPEKTQPKTTVFRPKSSKVNPTITESRLERRKTCCDFKNSDEYKEKLPKYNGYSSNYVSKEVFAKREFFRYKQLQCKQEKLEQQLEQKKLLAETNEEAFAQW